VNRRHGSLLIALAALGPACGQPIDVGSDLMWTARFESGNFDEATSVAGGGTITTPSSNQLVVSSEQVHQGSFAAKMTITTSLTPSFSALSRDGNLPDEAYYSAWFYVPQPASAPNAPVVSYWVMMRFAVRTVAADPSTVLDLYDIDLRELPSGEMTLRVFDYDLFDDATMVASDALVPVGRWFQVEVFYRNAPDSTGRLAVWLDGRLVADIAKATGASGWVGWRVGSIGQDLRPTTVTLFVDDCALSRVRVGPAGLLTL
jgi:hypothetical protein